MGENVQRSGWPMCSTLWNGDLLHWKGGNWSHVGPLAASMLMCLAREKSVTWRSESRPLSLWGSVWGAQLSEHHSKADPKQVFLNLDPSAPPALPQAMWQLAWVANLYIDATMGPLAQGLKRVGAVGRVEIRAGRDGVLRIGLRGAGFTQ